MRVFLKSGTILAASLALGSVGALAQTGGNNANAGNGTTAGQAATNTVNNQGGKASACRQQMAGLVKTMRSDGFWISGWGTPYGYGYGPAAPVAGVAAGNPNGLGMGPGVGNAGGNGGQNGNSGNGGTNAAQQNGNANQKGNAAAGNGKQQANGAHGNGGNVNGNAAGNYASIYGPFYGMGTAYYGYNSPRAQFQTLYSAANILADNGQTTACEAVVSAMQSRYNSLRQQLQKAGISADQIGNWRALRIAQAKPVRQLSQQYPFSAQNLIGTDIRNNADKVIGTVTNVAFNPKTGKIGYLVVARGGFLGIGDEHVGVPWGRFKATPGLNLLVLDATAQQVQNAPQVNTGAGNNNATFKTTMQQVRQYWNKQHQASAASGGQGQNGGSQKQGQKQNQNK